MNTFWSFNHHGIQKITIYKSTGTVHSHRYNQALKANGSLPTFLSVCPRVSLTQQVQMQKPGQVVECTFLFLLTRPSLVQHM